MKYLPMNFMKVSLHTAAVSSRGVIKAKAEGSAVITVKNGSKTVKVQVNVSK